MKSCCIGVHQYDSLMKALTTLSSLLLFSSIAFAHAGHGVHEGHSMRHYFLSWEHAIGILLAVVLAVVLSYAGVKWYRAKRQKS